MWPKLTKQVEVEREQLRQLLDTHRLLLEKCRLTEPDAIELSALAAMLHSFYTGIENLFKRVAIEIDGERPSGRAWHRLLLDRMASPRRERPAVISATIRQRLVAYLHFRHVFRHAYSFQLRWDKMSPLVMACDESLSAFRR